MAAGVGTRISRHLGSRPKCCVQVGPEVIIQRTVRILRTFGIKNVSIVLGYEADQVRKALDGFEVRFYVNPFFDITNSIVSLWFAREELTRNEDTLLMNGDLFFEPALIERVIESRYDRVLFADPRRKVEADYRLNYAHNILKMYGKELSVEETKGEYIGIAKITTPFLSTFGGHLQELVNQQGHSLWWEDVLYDLCSKGTNIYVDEVDSCFWAEVDYVEDFERIQAFLNSMESQ